MSETIKKTVIVRNLRHDHLSEMLAIEQRCFPDPWSEEWLEAMIHASVISWGSFTGKELIGYLIAMPSKDYTHLVNLAVDAPYRRKGIAQLMMNYLYLFVRRHKQNLIKLEVRRSNTPAIEFYKQENFCEVGFQKEYYKDKEDALVYNLEVK